MSPAAIDGHTHTRGSSLYNGGPFAMANGGNYKDSKGARIFPHLDDLTAVDMEANVNWSLRKLLSEAEKCAKQADTHLDFRRPDLALQDYIRASTVVVEVIPRHRDFPSLNTDRGDLHRIYVGLTKRITAQHPKFAEVKELIKENNLRSGVSPKSSAKSLPGVPQNDIANGIPSPSALEANGSPRKQPPAIQPKPNALHGNAIQSGHKNTVDSDLSLRFARLRGSDAGSIQQDPRINTRPISIPSQPPSQAPLPSSRPTSYTSSVRSLGPREMPSVPTTIPGAKKPSLVTDIPAMPRAPDAIYSPARGTEPGPSIDDPSSVPRSSSYLGSGRKGSAPPISNVGPSPVPFGKQKLVSYTHSSLSHEDLQSYQKPVEVVLPNSTTVTAEKLMEYLRLGSHSLKILLVDLRSREEYESGHILSQSIICVEPITLRSGISGDELEDSMVIAPDNEQRLFEQRDEFDLLVFYDQSSSEIKPTSLGKDNSSILRDFSKAVDEYGYNTRLKRKPMLLVGGLDAWVDLLGPNSLKTSLTSASGISSTLSKRRKARPTRLLSGNAEKKWDLALTVESSEPNQVESGEDFNYARTTEDFFRRFPEVPIVQESMVSQGVAALTQHIHREDLSTPTPPARPPPALPRQKSSGISDRGLLVSYAHSNANGAASTITPTPFVPGLTGLNNPSVYCYMNTAIQMISATPFLRNVLRDYRNLPSIPRKREERSPNPQLMARGLGNLIAHLWSGQNRYLMASTLMSYINVLHSKDSSNMRVRESAFGGSARMHDMGEFVTWLFVILEDELNPGRLHGNSRDALTGKNGDPRDKFTRCHPTDHMGHATYCLEAIKYISEAYQSVISQHMLTFVLRMTTCGRCGTIQPFWESTPFLMADPPTRNPYTLQELLRNDYGPAQQNRDYKCEVCPKMPDSDQKITFLNKICRMPEYLWIQVNRFGDYNDGGGKNQFKLTLTERVNLREFYTDLWDKARTHNGGRDFPPNHPQARSDFTFDYDVYAVACHIGTSIATGHYVAYARSLDQNNAAGSWHRFGDRQVTPSNWQTVAAQKTQIVMVCLKRVMK